MAPASTGESDSLSEGTVSSSEDDGVSTNETMVASVPEQKKDAKRRYTVAAGAKMPQQRQARPFFPGTIQRCSFVHSAGFKNLLQSRRQTYSVPSSAVVKPFVNPARVKDWPEHLPRRYTRQLSKKNLKK